MHFLNVYDFLKILAKFIFFPKIRIISMKYFLELINLRIYSQILTLGTINWTFYKNY